MMRLLIALALSLPFLSSAALPARADSPVVVELFTSQGCSSCPPADALLAEMAGREDVIPLALHVDYWDYIGWKDRFASPAYTKRQRGYAHAGGWRQIYTPQMVMNGMDHVVGSRPMKVMDLIRKESKRAPKADLQITRQGNQLQITASAKSGMTAAEIHVIRYTPEETVKIARGENAGRSITYSHIVKDWDVVGRWDGRKDLRKTVAISGKSPVVVLLQTPGHGPILAAARLR
jgi:hypothetical protein